MAFILGLMVENIMENLLMMLSKVMVNSHLPIKIKYSKVTGTMAVNTGRA